MRTHVRFFLFLFWGVNFYISIKYKAEGSPNYCTDQALSWRQVHGATMQFGSPIGARHPMGGGGEGLARRAGNGLEILRMSTAVIFWTYLS